MNLDMAGGATSRKELTKKTGIREVTIMTEMKGQGEGMEMLGSGASKCMS